MTTLFETIKIWANGQNGLNAKEATVQVALQRVVDRVVIQLRRHGSLGDLASDFFTEDSATRCRWILEEFAVSEKDTEIVRSAAHWQRFMELRHPEEVSR